MTFHTVKRQLKGLGCNAYEIGIFQRSQGKMLIRTWEVDQIIKHLTYLKQANSRGADIFCRPSGPENQGIILLDDLNFLQIKRLEEQGLQAAVVVETSPRNFQAWVRVCMTPLSKKIATQVAKHLAEEFQADQNSADWRHFGRFAGFTNKKPERVGPNGLAPWVLLHSYWGRIAPNGGTLIQKVEKLTPQTMKATTANQNHHLSNCSSVRTFQNLFQSLSRKSEGEADFSRIDWAVVKIILKKGYSPRDIAIGFHNGSLNIEVRKAGHIEDYIIRTIDKASKY